MRKAYTSLKTPSVAIGFIIPIIGIIAVLLIFAYTTELKELSYYGIDPKKVDIKDG